MKQTKPEFRMATAADVREFYDGSPAYSLRAYVALLDDKPVGLGGIAYRQGVLYAFLELKDEMRPLRISIAKFARHIRDALGSGRPGLALADPAEPNAGRFLEWLGFQYIATCEDGEVYQWRI